MTRRTFTTALMLCSLSGLLIPTTAAADNAQQLHYLWTVEKDYKEVPATKDEVFRPGQTVRFRAHSRGGRALVVVAAYNGKKVVPGFPVQVLELTPSQPSEVVWNWPYLREETQVFAVFLDSGSTDAATLKQLALNANRTEPAQHKLYGKISEWKQSNLRPGGKNPSALGGVFLTAASVPGGRLRAASPAEHPSSNVESTGTGKVMASPILLTLPEWLKHSRSFELGQGVHQVVLYNLRAQ